MKGFKEECFRIRAVIDAADLETLDLKQHDVLCANTIREGMLNLSNQQAGEIIANIMLAHRHLEDARMRLGKVLQVYNSGESCYPR